MHVSTEAQRALKKFNISFSLIFVVVLYSQYRLGYVAVTNKPQNCSGLIQQRCISPGLVWSGPLLIVVTG